MPEPEQILLRAVARAVLNGTKGTLDEQLVHSHEGTSLCLPALLADEPPDAELVETEPRMLDNGLGSFTPGGREYVIVLEGDRQTPLPWCNVIANPGFGTIVTAAGAAHTW